MGSVIAGAVGLAVLAAAPAAQAALVVQDLDHGATADGLAQSMAGSGVTISNVSFTGANAGAGAFGGGGGIVGFDGGIVLDSGKVQTVSGDPACARGVEGPNDCFEPGGDNSTAFGTPGDPDLSALSGFGTFDAAVLEFDFVPASSSAQFNYVFSSDEYSDFANDAFNDVFAFFVNGANCATVPGTGEPVSVNTINNGNPSGDTTPHHPELFRDNVNPSPTIDTQMDGLTTVLTCETFVNAGQSNHMKLAIADASDSSLDSAVFLQAGSFTSALPPPIPYQTVNVHVIKGVVLIKRPGENHFTPLEGPEQIPVGSQLDTTNGRVEIESASDLSGGVRTGQFYDGVFEVTQKPKGSIPITVLDLVPKVGCGKKSRDGGPPAFASGGGGNGLWGNESGGGHTTKGKKGSGSTRGTVWFVGDRCNGTTVGKVKKGKIKFRDFKKKKTITLKAGESYVAGK